MSINQRKTPFRYFLKQPITSEVYIISINGSPAPDKPIQAELCDISRSGCQLSFPLRLNVDSNEIRIGLDTTLTEEPLYMEGLLRWGAEKGNHWHYGVEFEVAEDQQERLFREMRKLAGQNRIIVK
ncbi:PilZ domain-containing protein [Paenibacillus tundrae]|uniref:PilZ domain-containing protein n=1 Tax=Paenibacillus tundrae TaxID=528187 RepID=A0ABT9WD68_9BACL|nr:PilZ domain-containing protein [Paenibacillus tundrae]MDQ0171198.1 hypothetical protein [Paenibacillus tundrae]